MKTQIFLFAHQDDEISAFKHISLALKHNHQVVVCYLTTGTFDASISNIRNNESIKVLTKLGVKQSNIIFVGNLGKIADKSLCQNLFKAYQVLYGQLKSYEVIERIYLHAWEGGHPDHDAVYLLGVALAKQLNCVYKTYQIPFYNGYNVTTYHHARVFNPILENGKLFGYKLSIKELLQYLFLLKNYRSQLGIITWLITLFIPRFFRDRKIYIQRVNIPCIEHPPHQGMLRYERYDFYSYNEFDKHTKIFRQAILNNDDILAHKY